MLADAEIEIRGQAAGETKRVRTDRSGRYQASLEPGEYEIRVVRQGFATFTAGITMKDASLKRDIELEAAARTEAVQVTGKAGALANSDSVYVALGNATPEESVAVENLKLIRAVRRAVRGVRHDQLPGRDRQAVKGVARDRALA